MANSRLEERLDIATAMASKDVTAEKDGTMIAMTQHRRALFVASIESLTTNGIATLTIRQADDTAGNNTTNLKVVRKTQAAAGFGFITAEAHVESMATSKTQLQARLDIDTTTTSSVLGSVMVYRGDGRYRPEDA